MAYFHPHPRHCHSEDANTVTADSNSNTPLLKSAGTGSECRTQSIAKSFQDWFSWELLSATIAGLSMTAIVTVLAIFDDSSLPDWPSVFTVRFESAD